jgi:tetratricopeptide (TPR) repeat protein
MMRLMILLMLVAAGCGEGSQPPAPKPPPAAAPEPPPGPAQQTPDQILASAERDRAAALYEQAITAFSAKLDAAAHEGRALARWRLSLMRGNADPEIEKDIEAAGDRPRAKALKALAKLVDGGRNGCWEPLAPRILKEVFAKAFPDSATFTVDWVALVRAPDGEIQKICEALAGAPDWPVAAGVRAALEGRDIPDPGQEGLLWILTALRLPPSEAMKTLEGATSPDQGILFQAQAQLLAAEGKFTEAVGRMTVAPLPVLRAASNVAFGKPAPALESLTGDLPPFGRALKAAALLQTGTEASLVEMDKLPEASSIAYVRFERGIRRLAAGNRNGAVEDFTASASSGGAVSAAWLGFALWHAQDFEGAEKQLAKALESKPPKELAALIEETRGYALQARGEEEAGAERLVAAAAKDPTRETYFRLATHLRANRQWKPLQQLAQAVVRTIPQTPEVWAARAEGAFWLKEYEASVQAVTFALEQKVDAKQLLKWRALSCEELGKWQEAFDDWSRLTDLASGEGEAYAHRAWMRAKLNRWADVRQDAELGVSRGSNAWALALARFALAAESIFGPPVEGEDPDPEARKEGAFGHLRAAVKTGAVETSDLEKIQDLFKSISGTEDWKKLVESAVEKQKELKDEAKKGAFLGVILDHGSGWVMVTGTYRKTGARSAGLAPGDVLLEVDGKRVNHISDVSSALTGREPGFQVPVKVRRELRPKLYLVEIRTIALSSRAVFEE